MEAVNTPVPLEHAFFPSQVIICSELMRKLMRMVERVARHNAAVLITGETGSGKELVARSIHQHSLRCNKPWVDVNCAALPEHLVESELFGYEKGAFSGADSAKLGMFELADKGTLFLDEIGELEPKIQVKLLRVLDGVPYYRLGGNRKIKVDVRIVAATNQDLEDAVRAGRFRSDLYHRLSHFQLKVPPLRERMEDVLAMAESFLQQHNPEARFSSAALDILKSYPWPGNVRELRNVVLQAAMFTENNEIGANDLPAEVLGRNSFRGAPAAEVAAAPAVAEVAAPVSDLGEMERQTILSTLASTGGHQGQAADRLGISRRTLSRKLKQYKLEIERRQGLLGSLSHEQQHYFRAGVDVPVLIRNSRGEEFSTNSINVSLGGIAVHGIDNPFQCRGPLQLTFTLADLGVTVKAHARVAWADVQGKAGIRFSEIVEGGGELEAWLAQRRQEEGWQVEDLVLK